MNILQVFELACQLCGRLPRPKWRHDNPGKEPAMSLSPQYFNSSQGRVAHWTVGSGPDQFEGQDVRLRSQAKVLAELLRHWGLDRPRIVGHDFGAATVMGAHLVEGCPVRDLVIADGVVLNPWGTPYSLLIQRNIEVFE